MTPHILIDWNSTIQNQKQGIIWLAHFRWAANLKDSDFSEWDIDLSSRLGVSREEWLSVWSNEWVFLASPPYLAAAEALGRLRQKYRIVVLTSAICGPDLCRRWLNENDIPHDEVIWAANKCGFGGLLVDDSPTVLRSRYEQKLMTVTFDQPWNRTFTKFPRLTGWGQIVH